MFLTKIVQKLLFCPQFALPKSSYMRYQISSKHERDLKG